MSNKSYLVTLVLLSVVLFIPFAKALSADEAPPIGFKALLAFDKWPLLADWPCYQASSYSRQDINADAGNFLRIEPNGEQVMMEAEGPGCIYRIWTTGVIEPNVPIQSSDKARFLIYFDGEEKPRIDLSVPELFGLRNVYPFIPPLSRSFESGRGAWEGHASMCYVPITFEKSIKVTGKNMSFYHINYYLFPKGTKVKSFDMKVAAEDRKTLASASVILDAAGEDPKAAAANAKKQSNAGVLGPGKSREIIIDGPAIIDALKVKIKEPTHLALRGLELQITFDDAPGPSVRSPLGDFFGTGCDDRRFKSLPLGMTDEGYYCYFPMPFHKRALIRIENQTDQPFDLSRFEVVAHSVDAFPENSSYFHAAYLQQKDIPHRKDYNILTTEGRGKYCGCNIVMQSAARAGGIFFLEGDEKIYVDGETWPSRYLGTGAEDYFNGAYFWNAVDYEHGPYSGLTYKDWGTKRVCAYRYHITDAVNFTKSIKVDIEHGPVSDHPSDFASVAYWYQTPAVAAPRLPAVADRMPVTYVSGGPSLRRAVKGVSGPKVGDKELPGRKWGEVDPEFVGTKPQRFWKATASNEVISLTIEAPAEEVCAMTLYLTGSPDGAQVEVALDGKTLGAINTYRAQAVPWFPTVYSNLRLSKGKHALTLKILKSDPRSTGRTVGWVGANFIPTSPFIKEWQVIGPFGNVNHSGFDKKLPPEEKIDLLASYSVLGNKKAGWKAVDVEDRINLASICGGGDWRIAYALTYIWAPERTETAVIFCKDDGAKIWVNDSLIFNENSWSHCFPDTYTTPIVLQKGWNTFLAKVANHGGSWAFGARICDPDRRLRISRAKK